jgi:hypothetical protein
MRFTGTRRKENRGVGSIIGATFIILILLSGFAFTALILNITDHYNETLGSMGESDWGRNQESIVIKTIRITGANQLNLSVENTGPASSRLIWLGIFNKSVSPESQRYYALSESIQPAETKSIVSDFTVVKGKKYAVQVVTELGNKVESKFYPASQVKCALTLVASPPTAYQGNNVTALLTVTNNDTEVDIIENLTVSLTANPSGLVLVKEQPNSLGAEGLKKGESVFFRWVYNTIGLGTVTFNASYSQAPSGTYALSKVGILGSPAGGGTGNVTITGVNCTADYNPSQWKLLGSTTYVSGSVSDLAANDSNDVVFRSCASGTDADTNDFVDSAVSDVDGSPNKGTHSNFTAQQYGPDGIYDTLTEQKMTTSFLVKKGTFTKMTTTGSQTITGVGFLPKAVIFWWTRQTAFGEAVDVQVGYGFATNYNSAYQNCGTAFSSDDGVGSSRAGRRRSETYCVILLSSGTPALGAQASVTGFDNDGFVLNWQTNEARADIVHFIALGGSDLNAARAGSFNLATGTGTQDIAGVGFQPEFAVFLWTFTEALDVSTADAEVGLGFAVSSAKRGAMVSVSVDSQNFMVTRQQQRTDSCILLLNPATGGQDAIADFTQFLADGFRVSKSDAPAVSTPVFYLALKGGDYDVGSFTSATATGTQDVTGVGFQPKLVMLATQGRTASTAIGSTSEMVLGAAASSTDRGVTWFEDPDSLGSSDNEMETLNTRVAQWRDRTAANTFTLRGSADFVYFSSDGFRVSWSSVEATGRQIIYVAFGGRNYELDVEARWTSVNYTQTDNWLCIYGGTMESESLRVDAWNGASWISLFASLSSGWNNASVSSYLVSSNFTIRFKDGTSTGDPMQTSWQIDVSLLHMWTVDHTAEVEFAGSSNLETWTKLVWFVQSCWDTGQVTVTIQLYNFALSAYPLSGNGYISYMSSAIPNTNELKSQTITSNPNDFKNSTGYWQVKIKGTKPTGTQFLMKVDWIDAQTTYSSSGSSIPYSAWLYYRISATTASGGPVPYAYVSVYSNGTSVAFRNAVDKTSVVNPAWVRLDANGVYWLELKSLHGDSETFILWAVVGSVVGQKTITQESP